MRIFIIIILSIIFTSCSSNLSIFYQIYETKSDNVTFVNEDYYYENSEIKISYDFWNEYGNPGFTIYNKTQKNIYLNLEDSHFIINGIAHDYYLNRTFTNSITESSGLNTTETTYRAKRNNLVDFVDLISGKGKKSGSSESTSSITLSSSENSVSYSEKKVIIIPSNSSKIINEYEVNYNVYRGCNFLRFPDEDEIKPIQFTKENSPYVFSNIICYSIDKDLKNQKIISNDFWRCYFKFS